MQTGLLCFSVFLLLCAVTDTAAQEKGALRPRALPSLSHSNDPKTPAKELFVRKPVPSNQEARSIGFYSAGCLAGGTVLPVNGSAWQVMRLSRNRNWGHPTLVRFLESLALQVRNDGIWNGLLIGDMSQPRGGPMITGHASHQVGLDADIWLRPMPETILTLAEREKMTSTNVVAANRLDVDPKQWTPQHMALIKAAALDPQVERIFVNPAIKKAICRGAMSDRAWLNKVRPYWGHDYHFHVRLRCPLESGACTPQDPPPPGDGCDKDLDWWFTDEVLHPKPTHEKPKPPLTMSDLPAACSSVLAAP